MKYAKVVVLSLLVIFLLNFVSAEIVEFNFNTSAGNDSVQAKSELVRSSVIVLKINSDKETNCKYSLSSGLSYSSMEGSFDYALANSYRETISGLSDGVYKYYIKCKENNNESKQLEVSFMVGLPVSAQITLNVDNDKNILKSGRTEVKVILSKIVDSVPVLSYSFDSISYKNIPLIGSGTNWQGYIIIPETQEESVGSFKFQARDSEGILGSVISEGNLFLVDSVKPKNIINIKTEGFEGMVKLSWTYDEKVSKYNLYRSTAPGVDGSDFYKSSTDKYLDDSETDKGKVYYYKISAVDDAGNEGDLSREVYATALIDNSSITQNGLDQRYLGFVDSFITNLDSVSEEIDSIKTKFSELSGDEKTVYLGMKLQRDFDSIDNEMQSLRREVSNYKTQVLTKDELDKKISSAEIRLSAIRKKTPDSFSITTKKDFSESLVEEDILKVVFEAKVGIEQLEANSIAKNSAKIAKEGNFKSNGVLYNFEIIYLDGTKKKFGLIKKSVEISSNNENISFLEVIPKEVAQTVSEINIINTNYEIVKEDPILSFDYNTREIAYYLDNYIDAESLGKIQTVLVDFSKENELGTSITGFVSLSELASGKTYFVVFIGLIVIIGLAYYLLSMRREIKMSTVVMPIRNKINQAHEKLKENNVAEASNIYSQVSNEYKNLGMKEKENVLTELKGLHEKINEVHLKGKNENSK